MARSQELPEPHDEVAEQRDRKALRTQVPQPRLPLSDLEREQYELRLDAYEVQLMEYRARLQEVTTQLDAAHHDGLTGTWLRQVGRQLLEQELLRAGRTGSALSIAFVDVDRLKELNDTGGHAEGDRALRDVAQALLSGLRGYDHVIRWGGDEFLCVLPGVTRGEALRRLEQARAFLLRRTPPLSISLGVVEREAGEDVDSLVSRADRELYASRGRSLPRSR